MRCHAIRLGAVLGVTLSLATGIRAADPSLPDVVRTGDASAVRAALAAGADVESRDGAFTPLTLAAIRGDVDVVRLLLAAGADPDAPTLGGMNALSMAVRSCHAGAEIIDALLAAGAGLENRSGDGITPLMLAIQEKRAAIALRLLEAGADVNTLGPFGDGALNYAIYVKDPVLIGAVLDRGVDTAQLRKLFTTIDYDPPGIDDVRSHHEVLCAPLP